MANDFYSRSSNPKLKSSLSSGIIRNEYHSIEEGFTKIQEYITALNTGMIPVNSTVFRDASVNPLYDIAGLYGGVSAVKTDPSSTGLVVQDTSGANTIMGSLFYTLTSQRESVSLILDEENHDWIIGKSDSKSTYFAPTGIVKDLAGSVTGDSIVVAKTFAGPTPVTVKDTTPGHTIMGLGEYLITGYRETVSLVLNVNDWIVL